MANVQADRAAWLGRAAGRADPTHVPVIELPIKPSPRGGSGAFLAADHDGTQWWVKPLNNRQGPMVPVTELLVGGAGRLIGAPVCDCQVVFLPPEIEGWEFRPGAAIESGFAHGSRAVDAAVEASQVLYRDRDDNRRRHAGVFALYDWCWGGDDQWLYSESDERKLYSHDHGWYLPETGPVWNEHTLAARVDDAHQPRWPTDGLDYVEIDRLSNRLRSLSLDELTGVLRHPPETWPVSDQDLETLGWFLERRAPAVAARLDRMRGGHQ